MAGAAAGTAIPLGDVFAGELVRMTAGTGLIAAIFGLLDRKSGTLIFDIGAGLAVILRAVGRDVDDRIVRDGVSKGERGKKDKEQDEGEQNGTAFHSITPITA